MRSPLATLALAALYLGGCGWEHYWGPYTLSVPTAITEPTDSRTFLLPLDGGNLSQQQLLDECLAATPDRNPPCVCDFPVLSTGELKLRVDYRLELVSGQEATVMLWLGREIEAGEPDPDEIPSRPRIDLLIEHHHRVQSGRPLEHALGESEIEAAELEWARARYAACPGPASELPGWQQLVVGVTAEGETEGINLQAQLVFYVRNDG